MKNLHNEILKYLYNNDTGKYIDLYAKFAKGKITKKRIDEISNDISDYIEKESVYESRGLLLLDSCSPNDCEKSTKLNVRINQKGRERYENIWHETKTHDINKKIALFTFIGVLVTALIFLTPNIVREINKRDAIIPLISLRINNNTDKEISIFHLQDFYLWFPGSADHMVGEYDILDKDKDDIIKLPKGTSYFSAKVFDNEKYFSFFKSQEYSISLSIRTDNGLTISDDLMPFSTESLNKYTTVVNIDE
jgi:hypothetical protein